MLKFEKSTLIERYIRMDFDSIPMYSLAMSLAGKGAIVAGGVWRTLFDKTAIADIDVFFTIKSRKDELESILIKRGYEVSFRCPEGKLTTLTKNTSKIQLIAEKIYTAAEDCIDSFDFDACRIAFDGEFLVTDWKALRSMRRKILSFHHVEFPVATLKRIGKYCNRGYKITGMDAQFFVNGILDDFERLNANPEALRVYVD